MRLIPLTFHHVWWIPSVILYYSIFVYLSKLNNDHSNIVPWYTSKYLWATFIFGSLCPFWIIVSRTSKNLIIDAFIYDLAMLTSAYVTFIVLGTARNFNPIQWIGVVFILIGFILVRIEYGIK